MRRSIIMIGVHAIVVPVQGAGDLGLRYRDLVVPLLRPLAVSIVCAPLLWLAHPSMHWASTGVQTLVAVTLYGVTYVGISLFAVMRPEERRRFGRAAMRRLPGSLGRRVKT